MYYLNKFFWFCLNPMTIVTVVTIVGLVLTYGRRRKLGWWMVGVSIGGLLIFSMPITAHLLGHGIERHYQEVSAKEFGATGDVVLDLGGSIPRSWYAAELVKAGKAPILIPSANNINNMDVPLIRDLGVSEQAILVEDQARNTEENIKFAKEVFSRQSLISPNDNPLTTNDFPNGSPRVLLVTSAVHMPRAMLTMRKYWPEAKAIPAPCDFQTSGTFKNGWSWRLFVPSLFTYTYSEAYLHEYIGYFYYRYFRR